MQNNTILIFVSEELPSFHNTLQEFQKLMKKLKSASFKFINVMEKPELAEEHKVEALPTLIFGDLRLVGKPDAEKMAKMITNAKEDQDFMKNYNLSSL